MYMLIIWMYYFEHAKNHKKYHQQLLVVWESKLIQNNQSLMEESFVLLAYYKYIYQISMIS